MHVCVYVYEINHRCTSVHSDMEMILWREFIPDHWHKWVYWLVVKEYWDFIPAAYLIMHVCVCTYLCVGSELGSLTLRKITLSSWCWNPTVRQGLTELAIAYEYWFTDTIFLSLFSEGGETGRRADRRADRQKTDQQAEEVRAGDVWGKITAFSMHKQS